MARGLCLAVLAACAALPAAAAAQELAGPAQQGESTPPRAAADFLGAPASAEAHQVADWVAATDDNGGLAFVIVDKAAATVFVFDRRARLRGASPALLGLARGDDSAPGVGDEKLSDIHPEQRTTPAGRFVAALGRNADDKDVVWVDYADAISMHRVITSNPREHRLRRLATATIADNRISYGCINLPAKFYEDVVTPAFTGADGVVYILPEIKSLEQVFFHAAAVAAPPSTVGTQ